MRLVPKVGGYWLPDISAWAELTMEHTWPGGSDVASFSLDAYGQHPAIREGATVSIFDQGLPVWSGYVSHIEESQVACEGLWRQASAAPSINAAAAVTTWPDDAVAQGIARGALSWTQPTGYLMAPFGDPATADKGLTIARLLDDYATATARRWGVRDSGAFYLASDPTAPQLAVAPGIGRVGTADEEFFNALRGIYLAAGGVETATPWVVTQESVAKYQRRERVVDLTHRGIISAAEAQAHLQGMLDLGSSRVALAEPIQVSAAELMTLGGTRANLLSARAGLMVRLYDIVDTSRTLTLRNYFDFVVGRSIYREGEDSVTLQPVGMAPRDFTSIMEAA